ncbi:hypothetical protein SAMN05421810_104475 [Amycolatopsis arida]|uniref:Pyridoxamine 5'-phosphate oxidase n=1 Tax=Amycolatopsis arida TaxID=587909 RepID=A0A1I5VQU2_9PSEU|nr:hypothetical protein CLV69_112121 [Amycolatopsis arida]SFQ09820.1 hypothetical protein SAMN05421810_104475 [Amycolatopsis arida]
MLATLRRDGAPRVSGSEVDFRGPDLCIGSMLDARKARDLRRDGRCALHANPGGGMGEEGDAKLAAVAVEVTDPDEVRRALGDQPAHLFRLDLTEAVVTSVEGNTLVVRAWHPGGPEVRYERPDNGPVVRVDA